MPDPDPLPPTCRTPGADNAERKIFLDMANREFHWHQCKQDLKDHMLCGMCWPQNFLRIDVVWKTKSGERVHSMSECGALCNRNANYPLQRYTMRCSYCWRNRRG